MDCIFCKIINKEIPSKIVYEDDDVLAFLDLSQLTYGHTLVVPKKHYDSFLEISDSELTILMPKVKKIANMIVNKLGAKGANIVTNAGEAAGQSVKHIHFHIIPRYGKNDDFGFIENSHEYNLDEIINKATK